MSLRRFFTSLRHAFHGLHLLWRMENSFRFQLLAAAVVLVAAFYFQLAEWRIIALALTVVLVLTAEIINSVVEKYLDVIAGRFSPHVAAVKDMLAAGVLLLTVGAVLIGVIAFWPVFATAADFIYNNF